MDIRALKILLQRIDTFYKDNEKLKSIEANILENKEIAVSENNQILAKEYWCIQQIFTANKFYINAFNLMKADKFYKSWCDLEKAELKIYFLSKHYDVTSNEYKIAFIKNHITKFQSLFPYKVFFSTELLEKKIQCSICDSIITPRRKCEHVQGEIYNGEMCSRHITDGEFLGLAIVENPVHKYAVAFSANDDNKDTYDYSLLKYLIKRLQSPFNNWDVEMTKRRHPHTNFKYIGRNDKCPCGSGKKYKKCCLKKSGVLMPHAEFIFTDPIPKELETVEYTYLETK